MLEKLNKTRLIDFGQLTEFYVLKNKVKMKRKSCFLGVPLFEERYSIEITIFFHLGFMGEYSFIFKRINNNE
ncbi:MAG: hypothetical protein J6Q87_02115 [Clostridia bacterium]|nr:hypothetical protein [Clostridia bacterium]